MKKEDTINPVEAGEILGVTRQQILKYIHSGILPSIQYKFGGRHHIKKTDVISLRDGKNNQKNKG